MKKSLLQQQDKPAMIAIWVVDDENGKEMLADHIRNGLKDCVERLAVGKLANARLDKMEPRQIKSSALAGALLWKYTLSFPAGAITMGCPTPRALDFVVFGFSDWDSPAKFLAGKTTGPTGEQIWPHVVFTDLHKGTRSYPARSNEVTELPGYQFAKRCLERGIPCVAFTSGQAMATHPSVFQGQDMFFFFDREEFKRDGKIAAAFAERLWPRLSRRLWLPEFTLAVEGRKNENENSFTVTFYNTAGRPVSTVSKVTPKVYTYLYLWCHGSVQARLFRWSYESASSHPAIYIPDNVYTTLQPIFESAFYSDNKEKIFYVPSGNYLQRTANILGANILNLDVPIADSLPKFWRNHYLAARLIADMKQILPEDGLKWLATIKIPPPPQESHSG